MDAYGHLRVLVSLVLGLSITRVLSGLSRRLQEPGKTDRMHAQIVWSMALLLGAVHFWWWEFALRLVETWNCWIYIFVLANASLFFLMSTPLYPDHLQDHGDREVFVIRRRHAFFALFAISFAFDLIDTLIKGREHFASLGVWYIVRGRGRDRSVCNENRRQPQAHVARAGLARGERPVDHHALQ
ncbi:hypothetical protein [Rhizobium sp. Rhizsp42]|uniref:hypothetical protein n=1 Tax=Rhizobium sp. Rhizsp42 TaxID=3243034 RepID=UPI0039B01DB4